jgi:GTP-binding protein Era
MVNMAETALKDADVILWVLDVSEEPRRPDQYIAETLVRLRGETPIILALNKADLRDAVDEAATEQHLALVSHSKALLVSALEGDGVEELVQYLLSQLPVGPRYYPGDQVSEVNMRFIAAEIVREKIILNTEHEIPHSVAIEVDSYEERSDDLTYISAIIYVERNSQKGIIIGKKGGMIRTIGAAARKELTGMLDTRVYLDLRVKVLKNWRQDEKLMKRLGYALPKDDSR